MEESSSNGSKDLRSSIPDLRSTSVNANEQTSHIDNLLDMNNEEWLMDAPPFMCSYNGSNSGHNANTHVGKPNNERTHTGGRDKDVAITSPPQGHRRSVGDSGSGSEGEAAPIFLVPSPAEGGDSPSLPGAGGENQSPLSLLLHASSSVQGAEAQREEEGEETKDSGTLTFSDLPLDVDYMEENLMSTPNTQLHSARSTTRVNAHSTSNSHSNSNSNSNSNQYTSHTNSFLFPKRPMPPSDECISGSDGASPPSTTGGPLGAVYRRIGSNHNDSSSAHAHPTHGHTHRSSDADAPPLASVSHWGDVGSSDSSTRNFVHGSGRHTHGPGLAFGAGKVRVGTSDSSNSSNLVRFPRNFSGLSGGAERHTQDTLVTHAADSALRSLTPPSALQFFASGESKSSEAATTDMSDNDGRSAAEEERQRRPASPSPCEDVDESGGEAATGAAAVEAAGESPERNAKSHASSKSNSGNSGFNYYYHTSKQFFHFFLWPFVLVIVMVDVMAAAAFLSVQYRAGQLNSNTLDWTRASAFDEKGQLTARVEDANSGASAGALEEVELALNSTLHFFPVRVLSDVSQEMLLLRSPVASLYTATSEKVAAPCLASKIAGALSRTVQQVSESGANTAVDVQIEHVECPRAGTAGAEALCRSSGGVLHSVVVDGGKTTSVPAAESFTASQNGDREQYGGRASRGRRAMARVLDTQKLTRHRPFHFYYYYDLSTSRIYHDGEGSPFSVSSKGGSLLLKLRSFFFVPLSAAPRSSGRDGGEGKSLSFRLVDVTLELGLGDAIRFFHRRGASRSLQLLALLKGHEDDDAEEKEQRVVMAVDLRERRKGAQRQVTSACAKAIVKEASRIRISKQLWSNYGEPEKASFFATLPSDRSLPSCPPFFSTNPRESDSDLVGISPFRYLSYYMVVFSLFVLCVIFTIAGTLNLLILHPLAEVFESLLETSKMQTILQNNLLGRPVITNRERDSESDGDDDEGEEEEEDTGSPQLNPDSTISKAWSIARRKRRTADFYKNMFVIQELHSLQLLCRQVNEQVRCLWEFLPDGGPLLSDTHSNNSSAETTQSPIANSDSATPPLTRASQEEHDSNSSGSAANRNDDEEAVDASTVVGPRLVESAAPTRADRSSGVVLSDLNKPTKELCSLLCIHIDLNFMDNAELDRLRRRGGGKTESSRRPGNPDGDTADTATFDPSQSDDENANKGDFNRHRDNVSASRSSRANNDALMHRVYQSIIPIVLDSCEKWGAHIDMATANMVLAVFGDSLPRTATATATRGKDGIPHGEAPGAEQANNHTMRAVHCALALVEKLSAIKINADPEDESGLQLCDGSNRLSEQGLPQVDGTTTSSISALEFISLMIDCRVYLKAHCGYVRTFDDPTDDDEDADDSDNDMKSSRTSSVSSGGGNLGAGKGRRKRVLLRSLAVWGRRSVETLFKCQQQTGFHFVLTDTAARYVRPHYHVLPVEAVLALSKPEEVQAILYVVFTSKEYDAVCGSSREAGARCDAQALNQYELSLAAHGSSSTLTGTSSSGAPPHFTDEKETSVQAWESFRVMFEEAFVHLLQERYEKALRLLTMLKSSRFFPVYALTWVAMCEDQLLLKSMDLLDRKELIRQIDELNVSLSAQTHQLMPRMPCPVGSIMPYFNVRTQHLVEALRARQPLDMAFLQQRQASEHNDCTSTVEGVDEDSVSSLLSEASLSGDALDASITPFPERDAAGHSDTNLSGPASVARTVTPFLSATPGSTSHNALSPLTHAHHRDDFNDRETQRLRKLPEYFFDFANLRWHRAISTGVSLFGKSVRDVFYRFADNANRSRKVLLAMSENGTIGFIVYCDLPALLKACHHHSSSPTRCDNCWDSTPLSAADSPPLPARSAALGASSSAAPPPTSVPPHLVEDAVAKAQPVDLASRDNSGVGSAQASAAAGAKPCFSTPSPRGAGGAVGEDNTDVIDEGSDRERAALEERKDAKPLGTASGSGVDQESSTNESLKYLRTILYSPSPEEENREREKSAVALSGFPVSYSSNVHVDTSRSATIFHDPLSSTDHISPDWSKEDLFFYQYLSTCVKLHLKNSEALYTHENIVYTIGASIVRLRSSRRRRGGTRENSTSSDYDELECSEESEYDDDSSANNTSHHHNSNGADENVSLDSGCDNTNSSSSHNNNNNNSSTSSLAPADWDYRDGRVPWGICYITEFTPWGTMRYVMEEYPTPLPLRAIHRYCIGILKGLDFLHNRHGVVHGYLSPENVMMEAVSDSSDLTSCCKLRGMLFWYDWILLVQSNKHSRADELHFELYRSLVQEEVIVGQASYNGPEVNAIYKSYYALIAAYNSRRRGDGGNGSNEQPVSLDCMYHKYRNQRSVHFAADVFSFGLILLELLSGEPPWTWADWRSDKGNGGAAAAGGATASAADSADGHRVAPSRRRSPKLSLLDTMASLKSKTDLKDILVDNRMFIQAYDEGLIELRRYRPLYAARDRKSDSLNENAAIERVLVEALESSLQTNPANRKTVAELLQALKSV